MLYLDWGQLILCLNRVIIIYFFFHVTFNLFIFLIWCILLFFRLFVTPVGFVMHEVLKKLVRYKKDLIWFAHVLWIEWVWCSLIIKNLERFYYLVHDQHHGSFVTLFMLKDQTLLLYCFFFFFLMLIGTINSGLNWLLPI